MNPWALRARRQSLSVSPSLVKEQDSLILFNNFRIIPPLAKDSILAALAQAANAILFA